MYKRQYLDVRNQTISKLPVEWQNITTLLSGKDSLTKEENKIYWLVKNRIWRVKISSYQPNAGKKNLSLSGLRERVNEEDRMTEGGKK